MYAYGTSAPATFGHSAEEIGSGTIDNTLTIKNGKVGVKLPNLDYSEALQVGGDIKSTGIVNSQYITSQYIGRGGQYTNRKIYTEAFIAGVVGGVGSYLSDPTLIDQLCKDNNGCTLTLEMVNWATSEPGNVASRQAKLFVSETSDWWRLTAAGNVDISGKDNDGAMVDWCAWDCCFTDAERSTDTNNGKTDAGKGFGLLNFKGGVYSDTTTNCKLIVED